MKTVFVLGQSISLHFGAYIQNHLGSDFVYLHKTGKEPFLNDYPELQSENGGTSADVLKYLEIGRKDINPDILIVGAGLHDIRKKSKNDDNQVSLKEYKKNISEIISLYKNSDIKLAWMTTTSFDENHHNSNAKKFLRYSDDNNKYNDAAFSLMKRNKVEIVDIREYTRNLTTCLENSEIYQDHIHFKKEIREKQAQFVADFIKRSFK
ncbi:MAG: lipolytic protein family [Patescibacteria group bacterium]|nr:lipolytic protein family [Patescibacteria group bacterium]